MNIEQKHQAEAEESIDRLCDEVQRLEGKIQVQISELKSLTEHINDLNEIIKKQKELIDAKESTYQEAYNRSLEYFNGDELAADVFVTKYALTDSQGNIKELTPDDMHRRMAKEFARIEKKYKHPLDEEVI